ncbi:transketolase [Thermodesulfatator autotrophicus]|uniref:Transketolase n=1 Tax=Thermodesulfatator autotrophicus TaxID=1795632 RepID=A0A177E829_9BACT|nr:transketolase [Thermodesulfatator autotrophicus]OAG28055.1 transketolase [Thermodesulfatator autotrophicus]
MLKIDLTQERLSQEEIKTLEEMWRRAVRRIILSTTLAGCGHPGGSLSSLHMLILLYALIEHDPKNPRLPERDRVVISHGHISPGVYSVLCEYGYFPEEPFLMEFRRAGSAFGGHVEQSVPGVEWNTGNLGQGLSAACGMARALKLKEIPRRVFCVMGDGEQQKGQVIEARRFAVKFGLNNLCALIDYNRLQIGGRIYRVMPQDIAHEIKATFWNVIEANGHDFNDLYQALRRFITGEVLCPEKPTAILAQTTMGKGISFMEDDEKWHGMALPPDLAKKALEELGFDPSEVDVLLEKRKSYEISFPAFPHEPEPVEVETGEPILYEPEVKTDCRSAYGKALASLAELNNKPGSPPKVLGITCDLEGSVKMTAFRKMSPEAFHEVGIQEHHAATVAGALSKEGFLTFFSTFGVFAVDETINQHRLNVLNETALKIVATHCGLDVGEDGPTHQCVDYLGLLLNLIGLEIYFPADPNQTDRIIRYVAKSKGNVFVGMGRSKLPVILNEAGEPFFGKDYVFTPGKADLLRQGKEATIIAFGSVMPQVLSAWEKLKEEGINISILNMASLRPLDEEAIIKAAEQGPIMVVEDHVVETGLGSLVAQTLAKHGKAARLCLKGVKRYGTSGKPADLYREQGLDADSIVKDMKELLA